MRTHLMHCSMQYSDSPRQQRQDLERIFDRAITRKVLSVGGTEAGEEKFRRLIIEVAGVHGYRVASVNNNDAWVAVRRAEVVADTWDQYYSGVIVSSDDGVGPHGNRGVVGATFVNRDLGKTTVTACHYLTNGRKGEPNYPLNLKLARAVGDAAKELGKGKALFFYSGDQNILDVVDDTFMGQPLTSAWDELKKWENTGHGNIDVIASYDADHRVKAAYCRALDDTEFPLNTDHWIVEAGFDVQPLKGGKP
jgi:hypothetical protein